MIRKFYDLDAGSMKHSPSIQQEAQTIVRKFEYILSTYSMSKKHRKEYAIKCALASVNETITHIQRRVDTLHDSTDVSDLKDYLQLREAIENI